MPFDIDNFSCVNSDTATVTASLRALAPSKLPKNWTCDDHFPDIALERDEPLVAVATAEVPFDKSWGVCDSGSLRAELTLVPRKKPPAR